MNKSARITKALFDIVSTVTPGDENNVVRELPKKITSVESSENKGLFAELLENVRLLFAMLRDKGYKLTWKAKAMLIGGLLYFILPTDVVPDFIPILGYIDDTTVVGLVIKMLSNEIRRYKQYRLEKTLNKENQSTSLNIQKT